MATRVRHVDGWIKVGFDGDDNAQCFLSLGDNRKPGEWRPAFRDYDGRRRVLQIRPRAAVGTVVVWQKVGGVVTRVGTLRL